MNKPGMPLAASTESSFDISTKKIAPGSSDIIVSTPADFIGAGGNTVSFVTPCHYF